MSYSPTDLLEETTIILQDMYNAWLCGKTTRAVCTQAHSLRGSRPCEQEDQDGTMSRNEMG